MTFAVTLKNRSPKVSDAIAARLGALNLEQARPEADDAAKLDRVKTTRQQLSPNAVMTDGPAAEPFAKRERGDKDPAERGLDF